ncbi:HSP20 family protein [Wenyingzhuangia heitensis]|uniref:HSP20 family protein n=1 Tax=Wenyingzhuangia heitensis TaxID=1487859 RepID=A0ABX0U7E6_9FLAO|nr:Hsp20/alpha crystallin family protein [Wenyingzhuangia heitensis]NIJ44773.1 HSP20 family protein [Wenyingzhuangia heitensis]
MFDRFLNDDVLNSPNKHFSKTSTTIPLVNVSENNDEFSIEMAIPGCKKEDFKIEVNNGVLTISSEKKETTENTQNQNYTFKEYSYQSFSRSFTLSDAIDSYTDGVLKIAIPKKEEAKPKSIKVIDVK